MSEVAVYDCVQDRREFDDTEGLSLLDDEAEEDKPKKPKKTRVSKKKAAAEGGEGKKDEATAQDVGKAGKQTEIKGKVVKPTRAGRYKSEAIVRDDTPGMFVSFSRGFALMFET